MKGENGKHLKTNHSFLHVTQDETWERSLGLAFPTSAAANIWQLQSCPGAKEKAREEDVLR